MLRIVIWIFFGRFELSEIKPPLGELSLKVVGQIRFQFVNEQIKRVWQDFELDHALFHENLIGCART